MLSSAFSLIAYIDPATGAIVLQAIIAAVLAGGVIFRRALQAPFAFLFKRGDKAEDSGADGE